MRKVDVTVGGPGGAWGGCYVYCAEMRLGKMYGDVEDTDVVVAHLLDAIERRVHEPVVLGLLTDLTPQHTGQGDLVTGDARVEVAPKPKKKRKRNYTGFDWGDIDG